MRVVAVVFLLGVRVAAADPVDTPPTTTGPSPLDTLAAHDAAYDRAIGFGTALTLRPGDVDISLRSVLNHGGMLSTAIGVTHSLELSVQAIRIGTVGVGFGAGAKVALYRGLRWALAVDANLTVGESRYTTASVKLSTCVADCAALITGGIGFASVDEIGAHLFDTMDGLKFTGDASIIIGTSWLRPLLEVAQFGSTLGFAGARFTSRHVAFDVGVGVGLQSFNGIADAGAVTALSIRP